MSDTIILLHGALGSKKQFAQLKTILSNDYQIYDLDFEGHGGVPSNDAFSIARFTANLLAFIEENQIQGSSIFGYSMGGYVALNLAKEHPALVSKIITLGTKFNWTEELAAQEVKMLNPDKMEAKVPAFANYLAQMHAPNDWKVLVRKTADMMLELAKAPPLTEQSLKKMPHKVLINLGQADKMVSLEESESTARLLSNGSLNVIPACPHPIEKVNMDQLAEIISQFLER